MKPVLVAGAVVVAASLAVPVLAQGLPSERVSGVVSAVKGDEVDLSTSGGQKATVQLGDKTRLTLSMPISIDQIKPGSYIGTGAMDQGSGQPLKAIEVTLFPDALRGAGEGHRGWTEGPQSSMTNGTVQTVVGTGQRTITVTYAGGQQTVAIPDGTPIVTFAAGDRSMLVPGAHVVARGDKAANGDLNARFVTIGKDGSTPPG